MPEPSGPMTAPTIPDDPDIHFLVTALQLRRVEVTSNRLLAERKLEGDGYRDLGQYLAVACEDAYEIDYAQTVAKAKALDAIHALFDGREVDSDTLASISILLDELGMTVRDPNEMEDDDADDSN